MKAIRVMGCAVLASALTVPTIQGGAQDKPATEIVQPLPHTSDVRSVAFSPDGNLIASGSSDKTVKLWQAATGILVRTFRGHSDPVTDVCA